MMKKISLFIYFFTAVVLLLWLLPWSYRFVTSTSAKSPFTMYSSVKHDFVMFDVSDDGEISYRDLSNGTYTEEQFDSLLPFFYTRQLMQDERLPDSINGVAVTPKMIQNENFMFFSKPVEINCTDIGLYFLMESMSKRVDLEMPDDVFRSTSDGLEFIDMASNSVNLAKSKQFTDAMLAKGFTFPVKCLNGNPTTRKEYDEGYVMLDSNNKLFHLKQVKGRPYVRFIGTPDSVELKHLFITEFKNRKSLAFATDINNNFYVLESQNYHLYKVAIPSFNPESENLRIIGNMIDWTVQIVSESRNDYYAIDASSYELLKAYETGEDNSRWPALHFTESTDTYVYPRF